MTQYNGLYKFRRVLSVVLALAVLLLALPAMSFTARAANFSGGAGTFDSPYQISTVQDLLDLAAAVNGGDDLSGKYFELTADIDLGGESWTPIGGNQNLNSESSRKGPFKGSFDGNGHIISGLSYISGNYGLVGLFGHVGPGGSIKNLGVSGIVGGNDHVGAIAGYNQGTIEGCYSIGTVYGARTASGFKDGVGGIAGVNEGTVKNCYSSCYVSCISGNILGGIVGKNDGTIENCYSIGTVTATTNFSGGIVGQDNNTTTNCHYIDEDGDFASEETFSGWDFGDTWEMSKFLGRPVLKNAKEETADSEIAGSGTAEAPFVIANSDKLMMVAKAVNNGNGFEGVYFELKDDIDLSGADSWEPIGKLVHQIQYTFVTFKFEGNFDGKDNIITFDQGAGLFMYNGGTISNLHVQGVLESAGDIGGIAVNNYGTIINCSFEGTIISDQSAGGIAGDNSGTIENCYNIGDISCGGTFAGGIAGDNYSTIENCYNIGDISCGGNYIGGIAGNNRDTIENCYNTGDVSGSSNSKIGGVIGQNSGDAANNYYLKDTAIGGIDGQDIEGKAESMTEAEFKYGEVAFLLQEAEDQDADIFWGQQLSEEPLDDSPILTDDESLRVVKFDLTYTDSTGEEKDLYTNSDADKAPVPEESSVTVGGTVIEFPDGGFIDKDFAVTVPEDGSIGLDDNYTVKLPDGGAAQANDEDGTVTVPAGTVITDISGAEDDLTVPDGKVAVYDPKTGKFTLDDASADTTPPGDNTPSTGGDTPSTGDNTPSTGNTTPSAGNNSDTSTGDKTDTSDGISADDINVGSADGNGLVTIGKDSVDTLKDEVIASHLTDEDKAAIKDGNKLDVLLSASDAADSVSDADKQAAEAVLDGTGYTAGRYLDIDLLKQINGEEVGKITELNSPITLVFIIPEELRKENRVFGIVRIHEGEAKFFEDLDNDPDTITIVTDRFSTYIIVYKDLDSPAFGNPGTGAATPIAITGLACAVIVAAVAVKRKKIIE